MTKSKSVGGIPNRINKINAQMILWVLNQADVSYGFSQEHVMESDGFILEQTLLLDKYFPTVPL